MASTLMQLAGQGRILKGSGSVTTTALAAAAEEILTITDANAALDDVVCAQFDVAALATAGTPAIVNAWVSVAGTISVKVSNLHASAALDAGAKTVNYSIIRAS